MRYAVAIFDFDGTLVDSFATITSVANAALTEFSMPPRTQAEVRPFVGLPLPEVMAGLGDGTRVEELCERYRECWDDNQPAPLYDGVAEVLDGLRDAGVRLAIATSRKREGLARMLGVLGVADHFEFLVGGGCTKELKPHAAPVRRVLDRLGVDARSALVIGDTTFDMAMGRAAGTDTCAVTYGGHERAALVRENPTHVVDAAREVVSLFF